MSNKKFSKSKKSDGSGVPNFVFNFSSSQPGSPLASPGGFNSTPSSPASTSFNFGSNSSQPFVFGDSPASVTTSLPTANTAGSAFTFGSPSSTTTPQFGAKRVQSDLSSLNGPERGSLRRTNSDLSFSVPPNNSAPSAAAPSFTFGTPSASPAANPTSSFSFGASTTPTLNPQPSFGSVGSQSSNISFSAPATAAAAGPTITPASTATPSASTPIGGFSFGTPSSTTATPSSNSVTFGTSPATTTPATSAFSFGAKPATDKPATPTFGFGANTTEKPAVPAAAVASAATTAASSPFSFGSTPASSTASTTPASAFSFGNPATSAATPSTSTTTTPSVSTATAPAAPAAAASPFTFNSPAAATPSKPADDKSTAAPAAATPAFSFGTPASTKASTTTPAPAKSNVPTFSFGAPAATTTSTATSTPAASTATPSSTPSTSLFSLGTISAGDKDKKPESAVTSSPFTFGAATTTTTTTTPANTTTIDPNKPNPFSFSKILDDLAKIAAQPPNQMYASLITPALAALQQNQVVSHTSFRIDNILPSTRFSELPEQAQKELDELEKYVRLEGQRCEYIGNHKVPQHLNAMAKANKDTELLSQQLDALSSTLKGRVESIESFYESVKTQLRYANEGCAVIEACKHPGNNARWLFGYSEDDDYFSQLAKQLSGRLEEYKKCIWEIETTAESWAHNRVQSPQDIADIMRAQNQAFLALSNKVAALHESVNVELNYYNQYLKMYS